MKKYFSLVLCVLLLLSYITPSNAKATYSHDQIETKNATMSDNLSYSPNKIIVKLKPVKKSILRLASINTASTSDFDDLGIDTEDVHLLNPSNKESFSIRSLFSCSNEENSQNNTYVVTLKKSGAESVKDAITTLCNNPSVEYAVPDIYLKTCSTPNDTGYIYTAYNALNHINASKAWDITTGSKSVVVGIIDSGIDGRHRDLVPNLWTNPRPNRNGYKNDIHGYDFANRKGGTPTYYNEHGTHVAGIVGAKGNNGTGVCGVNWNVQIAWLRISENNGNMPMSCAVEAINYANNNNIPILNASWGDYACFNNRDTFKPLEEAIKNYKGLFIAAAGNNDVCNDTYPHYPASFDLPNIISVGSAMHGWPVPANLIAMSKSGYSNYGINSVDIMAPGDDIYSTMPGNSYGTMSGTSMASPMVAGVAALVKAKYPNYTAAQIKAAILGGATKNTTWLSSYVKDGIALNAYGALLSTKPEPQEMTIGHIYSDITVEVGQSLKLYVNMTPVEADHTVTWYSENTDIVKINNDGCYFALKPGTTTLTATSTINPNCTKSVSITVIPAKSAVAKFEDENFRKYVTGFLNEFYQENGLRYEGSKIYLSETQAITGMDLCGIGIQSLNDLKNFENLETLSIAANPLTGTLNLTALKKLKHLSIDSVIFNSLRSFHYDKSHYNYTITGLKAIIGGEPVNLNLKGSGFMEIELHNGNGHNGCQIDVNYEATHKPVNATLNGKTFYPSEDWFATYYFKCDKPININIEIQPGINIQNPSTYQTIGEKLKKIDPLRYPYFDWKSGYKLTASDVAEFFNWKPMCDYDLKLAGVENLRVSLSETSYIYNGKVRTPKVTVKDINGFPLTKNEDYTVKYSSGRKNIGKYSVTVTFKGQYSGKKVVYFTINPKIKISSTKYTYTGKTKRPTVTITNSSGKKISTKYYSVGYSSDRKKVGKYTITIKFKNGHSGTYKKTFTIVPKGTTASKLTAAKKSLKVTIKKQSAQTTGYEIQYSTSKKFPKSTTKTKTINSYKTTRSTIKSLKAKRTYYVRVRTYKTVGKTKYYSAWSKYKSIKTK